MELKELSYDSPLGGQFISAALWTEEQVSVRTVSEYAAVKAA